MIRGLMWCDMQSDGGRGRWQVLYVLRVLSNPPSPIIISRNVNPIEFSVVYG
jgi:hypothetical protein